MRKRKHSYFTVSFNMDTVHWLPPVVDSCVYNVFLCEIHKKEIIVYAHKSKTGMCVRAMHAFAV